MTFQNEILLLLTASCHTTKFLIKDGHPFILTCLVDFSLPPRTQGREKKNDNERSRKIWGRPTRKHPWDVTNSPSLTSTLTIFRCIPSLNTKGSAFDWRLTLLMHGVFFTKKTTKKNNQFEAWHLKLVQG